MASICTSPKQVVLKYTTVLPQEVQLSTVGRGPRQIGRLPFGFKRQPTRVRSSNPDEVLTWAIVSNPEGDFLEYDVDYVTANPNNQKEINFKAYFTRREGTPGYWIDTENWGYVYWIYQEEGETVFSNSHITYYDGVAYHYSLIYPEQPVTFHTNRHISSIAISGGGTPAPSKWYPYSFIWKVYQGGNLVKSARHDSKTANFPASDIVILDAKPGHPESKVFNFPTAPLSVELKLKQNTEYSYQVIAKYSDDTEEVIHFFYGIDPTLLCFSEVGECPENTCQVDCGEHYCCYGSDGIAVHSFLK
ncbi:MAG: hypothetical protein AB4372_14585 [Xenococcus sp. (in: cyanobacteria)]